MRNLIIFKWKKWITVLPASCIYNTYQVLTHWNYPTKLWQKQNSFWIIYHLRDIYNRPLSNSLSLRLCQDLKNSGKNLVFYQKESVNRWYRHQWKMPGFFTTQNAYIELSLRSSLCSFFYINLQVLSSTKKHARLVRIGILGRGREPSKLGWHGIFDTRF